MPFLRLPVVGDFAFVSKVESPENERKYIVVAEGDDGYYIRPEDEPDNMSTITYNFDKYKWVVVGAENMFKVQIELNRNLHPITSGDSDIRGSLEGGNLDDVKRSFEKYQNNADLVFVTTAEGHDEDIYQRIEDVEILNWFKRNYIIDYGSLFMGSFPSTYHDSKYDFLVWLLDNWSDSMPVTPEDWENAIDASQVTEALIYEIIPNDDVKIFEILSKFQGLLDPLRKRYIRDYYEHDKPDDIEDPFIDLIQENDATKILDFLRKNPSKAARKR